MYCMVVLSKASCWHVPEENILMHATILKYLIRGNLSPRWGFLCGWCPGGQLCPIPASDWPCQTFPSRTSSWWSVCTLSLLCSGQSGGSVPGPDKDKKTYIIAVLNIIIIFANRLKNGLLWYAPVLHQCVYCEPTSLWLLHFDIIK